MVTALRFHWMLGVGCSMFDVSNLKMKPAALHFSCFRRAEFDCAGTTPQCHEHEQNRAGNFWRRLLLVPGSRLRAAARRQIRHQRICRRPHRQPDLRTGLHRHTGHAEVTQIEFYPAKISYEKLLDVFWQAHDPTTLNRQGADEGTQYRSVILYHSEAQKLAAEKSKAAAQKNFKHPIVTEIVPFTKFYRPRIIIRNFTTTIPTTVIAGW